MGLTTIQMTPEYLQDRRHVKSLLCAYLTAQNALLDAIIGYEAVCENEFGAKTGPGDGMPHSRNTHRDLSDWYVRKDERAEAVSSKAAYCEQVRSILLSVIEHAGLTAEELAVVKARYIDLHPVRMATAAGAYRTTEWTLTPYGQIGAAMNMTYSAVTHAHDRAIEKLSKRLACVCEKMQQAS